MKLERGTLVDGRYRVERLLGRGGQAEVYLVRHADLGSWHAMKLVEAHPTSRARILHEGQVQAALNHPHVVRVTDVVDVGPSLALIMEYVQGPDLSRVIRHQRLSLDQVDAVARAVLSAMSVAHDHGLVHRDLKPENILLDRGRHGVVPKVSDFGLALQVHSLTRQTPNGALVGTPFYMSPEQVKDGRTVDRRSDIWAIGAILYELLTGRLAFEGEDLLAVWNAVAQASPVPMTSLAPDLPPRMVSTIERALQADPVDRFADCRSMLAAWDGTEVALLPDQELAVDLDLGSFEPVVAATTTWDTSTVRTGLALGVGALGLFAVLSVAAGFVVALVVSESAPTAPASAPRLVVGTVSDERAAPRVARPPVEPASPEAIHVPAPPPARVTPRMGEVVATGARVSLRQGGLRYEVPGPVPIGAYDVVVAFGAEDRFVYPRPLVVEAQMLHEVVCNPGTQLCNYQQRALTP